MKAWLRAVVSVALAGLAAAQTGTAPGVEITSEPHHHLALENSYVRAFQVEVPPHQSTLMHWHRHDYMFVTLGASEVENDVAGKPPVALKLPDGDTRFAPAPFAHIAKNLADTPFRNVTIEFLHGQKGASPAKWDQERGLNVLNGGTQDILFVKDAARVSEIELQPGGSMPGRRHAGPHLLVAVSDLELRSDGKGGALHLKSGDLKWVPAGHMQSLTNAGKSGAKFVIVEFH